MSASRQPCHPVVVWGVPRGPRARSHGSGTSYCFSMKIDNFLWHLHNFLWHGSNIVWHPISAHWLSTRVNGIPSRLREAPGTSRRDHMARGHRAVAVTGFLIFFDKMHNFLWHWGRGVSFSAKTIYTDPRLSLESVGAPGNAVTPPMDSALRLSLKITKNNFLWHLSEYKNNGT